MKRPLKSQRSAEVAKLAGEHGAREIVRAAANQLEAVLEDETDKKLKKALAEFIKSLRQAAGRGKAADAKRMEPVFARHGARSVVRAVADLVGDDALAPALRKAASLFQQAYARTLEREAWELRV